MFFDAKTHDLNIKTYLILLFLHHDGSDKSIELLPVETLYEINIYEVQCKYVKEKATKKPEQKYKLPVFNFNQNE